MVIISRPLACHMKLLTLLHKLTDYHRNDSEDVHLRTWNRAEKSQISKSFMLVIGRTQESRKHFLIAIKLKVDIVLDVFNLHLRLQVWQKASLLKDLESRCRWEQDVGFLWRAWSNLMLKKDTHANTRSSLFVGGKSCYLWSEEATSEGTL